MRIGVIGEGATGGLMGARLAVSGQEVILIDQGEHLAAIKANGLKLKMRDGEEFTAENVKARIIMMRPASGCQRVNFYMLTTSGPCSIIAVNYICKLRTK